MVWTDRLVPTEEGNSVDDIERRLPQSKQQKRPEAPIADSRFPIPESHVCGNGLYQNLDKFFCISSLQDDILDQLIFLIF